MSGSATLEKLSEFNRFQLRQSLAAQDFFREKALEKKRQPSFVVTGCRHIKGTGERCGKPLHSRSQFCSDHFS
jgi:hypothetical protein